MKSEKSQSPPFIPRFLVIDDDFIVSKVVQRHIQTQFSNAIVDISNDPMVHPSYNVYFVDNNFNGQEMALSLLREIREIEPQALVVALSNTLDLDLISKLVNNGCNVIYDKADIAGSHEARKVIANYLCLCEDYYYNPCKNKSHGLLSSIKQLLNEWNHRLPQDGSTLHKTPASSYRNFPFVK